VALVPLEREQAMTRLEQLAQQVSEAQITGLPRSSETIQVTVLSDRSLKIEHHGPLDACLVLTPNQVFWLRGLLSHLLGDST
jgi:hypothetical protein